MSAAAPLFSVIIANFRSGPKLRATADSILNGTHRDLELIVVDSASADESLRDAVALVQADRDRVRLVSQKDAGIYDAMNHGLRLARGRYILFMGAGDLLMPDALAKVAPLLPAHDRGFVYGDVMMGDTRYAGPFDHVRLAKQNICHQAIFYGREAVALVGEYNARYRVAADLDMNIRCFADRRVEKKYVDVVVADYEGGGFSAVAKDEKFNADVSIVFGRAFGVIYLRRHRGRGVREFIRYRVKQLAFWRQP